VILAVADFDIRLGSFRAGCFLFHLSPIMLLNPKPSVDVYKVMTFLSPMKTQLGRNRTRGFALVTTLVMMVLLTILTVGLLSLSAISLRSSQGMEARRIAQSNARIALMMALNELQTTLGDDRRITADASILGESVSQPNLVGVWRSTPSAVENDVLPLLQPGNARVAPNYSEWKDRFEGWLVSNSDPDASASKNFAMTPEDSSAPLLFNDGVQMRAGLVGLQSGNRGRGAYAWGVIQEATRAQINVGGDERLRLASNDSIHAPDRPNLGLSEVFTEHPRAGWETRGGKVLGLNQAALDSAYNLTPAKAALLRKDHTAHSRGVHADVVAGGLKKDLSLAFEADLAAFNASEWDGVPNPFAGGVAPNGEVPLYRPATGTTGRTVSVQYEYDIPMSPQQFDTGAPPTFHNLRSYYRMYQHMYQSGAGLTAFHRNQASTYYNSTGATAPRGSETAVAPVLDRIMFFLSMWQGRDGFPHIVFTPVITLWNPYNVAIEAEGYIFYPWMDMPVGVNWTVTRGTNRLTWGSYLSTFMGKQFEFAAKVHGRQTDPYFFCEITQGGAGRVVPPLVLKPGEVRIFAPTTNTPIIFERRASDAARTVRMRPVGEYESINTSGGLAVPMGPGRGIGGGGWPHGALTAGDQVQVNISLDSGPYHYFVTLEDAGRIKGGRVNKLAEVQLYKGKQTAQSLSSPQIAQASIVSRPQMVGILETYHRTAATPGQISDIVFTVNPRQRYINAVVSGGSTFVAGPHYDTSLRGARDPAAAGLQTSLDGTRAYYGESNAPGTGRDYLSFFEFPRNPMMSLGGFQTADLADSAFATGNQFGNSWAPAYLARNRLGVSMTTAPTGEALRPSLGVYDHSYLLNAALWDGYFLSSIAPKVTPGTGSGSANVYNSPQVNVTASIEQVLNDWVRDPGNSPLRNPRHTLHLGGTPADEVVQRLAGRAGPLHDAAHLLVDGMFNVNSTSEEAWKAMLASLRGQEIDVLATNGSTATHRSSTSTPVPRLSQPTGIPGDRWNGFRELSDQDIETLAEQIVVEVRKRGPFQSMGEFVNRRLANDETGLKGALQTAIDNSKLNDDARVTRFDTSRYPNDGRRNLPEPYTGIGTPGWLTQGDLLNGLGPFLTVRSDTFTVRGYGEAHDPSGKVIATAYCEAVVQRVPEWVDSTLEPHVLPSDYENASPTSVNGRFGRRFEILSFRELSADELDA
jgi:type II secretory pathway pseudopilin PulG